MHDSLTLDTRAVSLKSAQSKSIDDRSRFVLLLIGAASPFYVVLQNRIYPTELIFFALAPVALIARRSVRKYDLRLLLPLAVLWLSSQILTDNLRSVQLEDALSGSLNIVFFAVDLLVLLWLIRTSHDAGWFAGGLSIGLVATTIIQPGINFVAAPWKFGYATPIAILCLLFISRLPTMSRRKAGLPLLFLAVVNLLLDYRSLAVLLAIGGLLFVLSPKSKGKARRSLALLGGSFVIAASAIAGFSNLYGQLSDQGLLGESASVRFQSQSTGQFGILVGARKELVAMGVAISESPLLGQGSGAGLTVAQYDKTITLLHQAGYQLQPIEYLYLARVPLPPHSALLGSWFLGGLGGLIFWLYISKVLVARVRLIISQQLRPTGLIVAAWCFLSILASPLASDQRMILALALVSVLRMSSLSQAPPADVHAKSVICAKTV